MIVKDGTDEIIEKRKMRCGLVGDVYIFKDDNGVSFIENLEGHKRLVPGSTAETIEEAYEERVIYEAEKKAAEEEARRKAEEERALEGEGEGDAESDAPEDSPE